MKNVLYLSVAVCFLAFFSTTVSAQSPKNILKQATKALGGEKNLEAVTSWQKRGLITKLSDGSEGEYQAQASQSDFYNALYDLNGFEYEVGYNGKSGWVRDSREGLKTLTGDESADFKAEVLYRNLRWLDYKKQKAKVLSGGNTNINGKPVNIVNFTTASGVTIRVFFDAKNNLPLREEIPAGDSLKTFDYSDYRPVGAVKEPFNIKVKIGEDAYEIQLDQILHNPKIAESEFNFPNLSNAPLPDIAKLLAEVQANEDKVEEILDNYSFKQKITDRELGKDGILREKEAETYLLSFYKGYRIRRLVGKDGKPLSEEQQAKEDKKTLESVEDIEKKIAKQEEKAASRNSDGSPDENSRNVSIAEVLRASKLINPRRERLNGRDVIVFDFEPNPDFDTNNAKSVLKFFGKVGGAIWIDEQDKQVARVEAALFDSYKVGGGVLAKLRKGATFTLKQERVGDEIWLPAVADINLSVRVLLFKGVNVNKKIESFDYQKFNAEVKDAKIGDVQKP